MVEAIPTIGLDRVMSPAGCGPDPSARKPTACVVSVEGERVVLVVSGFKPGMEAEVSFSDVFHRFTIGPDGAYSGAPDGAPLTLEPAVFIGAIVVSGTDRARDITQFDVYPPGHQMSR